MLLKDERDDQNWLLCHPGSCAIQAIEKMCLVCFFSMPSVRKGKLYSRHMGGGMCVCVCVCPHSGFETMALVLMERSITSWEEEGERGG